jgi:protein-tyrosine-phosphatase
MSWRFPSPLIIVTSYQFKIPISHRGRQVNEDDFTSFTHILAADGSNLRYLMRIFERLKATGVTPLAKVALWGSYMDGEAIADPYYGDIVSLSCIIGQIIDDEIQTLSRRILRHVYDKSLIFPTHFWIKCLTRSQKLVYKHCIHMDPRSSNATCC